MSSSNGRYTVSNLRFPRPMWRYLLLFQSWAQFQAWTILILMTVLIINGLIIVTAPKLLPPEGVFIGAILGSLCSVFMVLPAEFEIKRCSSQLLASIKSELEALGYGQLKNESCLTVYQQKLPKLLRWKEGNVCIKRIGENVTVGGAFLIVLKVQRALLRLQENESI